MVFLTGVFFWMGALGLLPACHPCGSLHQVGGDAHAHLGGWGEPPPPPGLKKKPAGAGLALQRLGTPPAAVAAPAPPFRAVGGLFQQVLFTPGGGGALSSGTQPAGEEAPPRLSAGVVHPFFL